MDKIKQELLKDRNKLPKHIAIIMDGNGRWAKNRKMPRLFGHQWGSESVRHVIEIAVELQLEVLTLFAFSDENWKRPPEEISGIFALLEKYALSEGEKLKKHNIRLKVLGNLNMLPKSTANSISALTKTLESNTGLQLVLALSYGARSEITQAFKAMATKILQGQLSVEAITPASISEHLWTQGLPDPDLLIRTSGEQRISNFLLWQLAYTELWFTPVQWPDFKKEHFLEALLHYTERQRRFGGL